MYLARTQQEIGQNLIHVTINLVYFHAYSPKSKIFSNFLRIGYCNQLLFANNGTCQTTLTTFTLKELTMATTTKTKKTTKTTKASKATNKKPARKILKKKSSAKKAAPKARTKSARTPSSGELNGSQVKLLLTLGKSKKEMDRKQLSAKTGINKGFSRLLGAATKDANGVHGSSSLIGLGFVKAEKHEDSRTLTYALTAKGRKKFQQLSK